MDLDAIRKRLQFLKDNNQRPQANNLWKPAQGDQVIRIVPYIHDRENPFRELWFHYGISDRNPLSLKTFGEPDPICEFAEQLKASRSTEDFKLGKSIEPKMRTFVPVIVRGKEHEGVKFWGFGKEVYYTLLETISDPDFGDITDPKTGRDITVTFKTAEQAGKSFPETTIRVKPNISPMTTDKAVVDAVKNQPVVTDIFKRYTYEELEGMLRDYLNVKDGGEPAQLAKPAYNKPAAQAPAQSKPVAESAAQAPAPPVAATTPKSAEALFDGLF